MSSYEDPRIYEDGTVTADQRRDVPYYENTVGTVIGGGATGVLAWADNFNRKAWGRKDADGDLYYELEVRPGAAQIRVYHADELGDDTYTDYAVAPSTTYTTLVDGVSVPLNGSLTAGDKARVYPGSFMLDDGAMYCPRGQGSDWIRYAVHNAGSSVAHKLCNVQVVRGHWFENTSGTPILALRSNVVNPIADTYFVTVANGTHSGKKFTFAGTYNTYTADDVVAGSTNNPIGASGLVFDAGASPSNTDTAMVIVDDQADAVELCTDNAGSPDTAAVYTWNSGSGVRMPISPPGATDQVNPAGGIMFFWGRINPGATFSIGRGLSYWYVDVQRAA